jgi:hypothetical protein
MVDFCTGDREYTVSLYRDPLFDKCLEALRAKGGESLVAARKVDEFIDILLHRDKRGDREKFRFTRKGEARIKNCKKIDLGCGYRIVCIKKDGHLALLYVGTHDECFRWIERNQGMKFDVSASNGTVQVVHKKRSMQEDIHEDVIKEQKVLEEDESLLMSRISDDVLRKVFHGLCNHSLHRR